MIRIKQVQGLSNLIQTALINASQADDGTVTLTRGDGTVFTFPTDSGVNGEKGDKGDKGDKGPNGLGAYELAVAGGYAGTEVQWRASLKGDTGDKGLDAKDGDVGHAGITPTFQSTVNVTNVGVGNNPTIQRETIVEDSTVKTYSISLGIPQGKIGITGVTGTSYTINTAGAITKVNSQSASVADASISWSGTVGMIHVTLPKGIAGEKGSDVIGTRGGTPTLSSVSKGSDLSAGSTSWICSRSGTPAGGSVSYTIQLGQAAKGDKGAAGYRGSDGSDVSMAMAYKDTDSNYWPFGRRTEIARLRNSTGSTFTAEWGVGNTLYSPNGALATGWYVGRHTVSSGATNKNGKQVKPGYFAFVHVRDFGSGHCCHDGSSIQSNSSAEWNDILFHDDKVYAYYDYNLSTPWASFIQNAYMYKKSGLSGPT